MVIDTMFEAGNFSTLRDVILSSLKVLLFHSKGCGSFHAATTPPFINDYRGPILGLSNEVLFVSEPWVFPEIQIKMFY